jgi:fatty acid desaturase
LNCNRLLFSAYIVDENHNLVEVQQIDDSFVAELEHIRHTLKADSGKADVRHLRKIQMWGWLCGIAGLSTAWIIPNLLTAFLISLYRFTAWTMLAHHILHKGYDNVPGVPSRLTSNRFASGWRRWMDWPDWIWPPAWHLEHNVLHHYHLGETSDPDLVEINLDWLRRNKWPRVFKYILIFFMAGMWKYIYYAPNTWLEKNHPGKKIPPYGSFRFWQAFSLTGKKLWLNCFLPYIAFNFILIPAPFLLISPRAALFVCLNMVIAEWLTNFHTFLVIVTNHAGDDLPRFDRSMSGKKEFYVRQISGSVNFRTGAGLNDFMHGFLNYQIEHHLWPDMTMLQYKKAHPLVKSVAAKYGLPYLQQSVWKRLGKTVSIMVGTTSMRNGGHT